MTRTRWPAAVLIMLVATGCHSGDSPSASPQTTPNAPGLAFCRQLGGTWNTPARSCTLTGRNEHTHIKVSYPVGLLEDPAAGPALKDYVESYVHRRSDEADDRESNTTLTHTLFHHGDDVTSVLFHGEYYTQGTPHPTDEYATFTFDTAEHRRLQLADLFCPGVDPLQAIPPLIRSSIEDQLGDTPLNVEDFEPDRTRLDYSDGYRAWLLDDDDLVFYLPAERTGPVTAGMVTPRLALSDPDAPLRQNGCPT